MGLQGIDHGVDQPLVILISGLEAAEAAVVLGRIDAEIAQDVCGGEVQVPPVEHVDQPQKVCFGGIEHGEQCLL